MGTAVIASANRAGVGDLVVKRLEEAASRRYGLLTVIW